MSDDDLRARIEAQKAARREAAEQSRHTHSLELPPAALPAPPSSASVPSAAPPLSPPAGERTRSGRHSRAEPPDGPPVGSRSATIVHPPIPDPAVAMPPTYVPAPADAPLPIAVEPRQPRSTRRTPSGSTRRTLVSLLVLAVTVAVATFVMRTFVIASYWIPSASMEPTLHGCPQCNDDHVLVSKLSYKLHDFHRGDVIVFSRPPNVDTSETVLIKRVIGLPGDVLTEQSGKIYVGGRLLSEPYIEPACRGVPQPKIRTITVPKKMLFVMGDNRCDSTDSRIFGPIPESTVVGRAFLIVWPTSRWHWI